MIEFLKSLFNPKIYCPKCGGELVQDKCDRFSNPLFGFYKVWTCTKCGEEFTNGSSI